MTTDRKMFAGVMMLISAIFSITSTAVFAQANEAVKERRTETRVIHLEHARASQLSDVVSGLFRYCGIGVDHRTNSIITRCPPDDIEAIQDLVARLDVESGQEYEQALLRVSSMTPGLREMLNAALDRSSRVAIDPVSETVGIWGTPDDIRRAHEVIATLEQNRKAAGVDGDGEARSSYQMHFYYVAAQYGNDDPAVELPSLPDKLGPVGDTLIEDGFQKPSLLASMALLAHLGQDFNVQGSVDLSDIGDEAKVEMQIHGELHAADMETVTLELQTALVRVTRNPKGGGTHEVLFELNTTIECALDEYLVLSASPAGAKLFDAVALVIHVTR